MGTTTTTGFIGAGNMARALIKAIVTAHPEIPVIANDISEEKLQGFETNVRTTTDVSAVVAEAGIVFLCVKPQVVPGVVERIRPLVRPETIVVSIAAGVRLASIDLDCRVVRVMPNTPCLVGEMAAAYCANERTAPEDKAIVLRLLGTAGTAVELEEARMDAVTGLSGSGPAFVARIIEGFIEGGTANGLDATTAKQLTLQTFVGTARMLENMEPDALIRMVTSPNGTTAAGREVIDRSPLKTIIADTVTKAVDRSRELGQ